MKQASAKDVLELLAKGGSLRYFYLSGTVLLHNEEDDPRNEYVAILDFQDLERNGFIHKTGEKSTGYPHYADGRKSSIYGITPSGRVHLGNTVKHTSHTRT